MVQFSSSPRLSLADSRRSQRDKPNFEKEMHRGFVSHGEIPSKSLTSGPITLSHHPLDTEDQMLVSGMVNSFEVQGIPPVCGFRKLSFIEVVEVDLKC
ncbi:hypothetical protein JTE90_011788 [Oedothorax gibbosus]|uniref:Uncharacterized protein n=1 Tax=Oedothorax gibbosus TaxID=931172 RepID=A0AAV6VU77_9ARAC|nr:hypothetical protein JTE90_011788 [Oedothorax gibbosus]